MNYYYEWLVEEIKRLKNLLECEKSVFMQNVYNDNLNRSLRELQRIKREIANNQR
jgi:hypothetical protein